MNKFLARGAVVAAVALTAPVVAATAASAHHTNPITIDVLTHDCLVKAHVPSILFAEIGCDWNGGKPIFHRGGHLCDHNGNPIPPIVITPPPVVVTPPPVVVTPPPVVVTPPPVVVVKPPVTTPKPKPVTKPVVKPVTPTVLPATGANSTEEWGLGGIAAGALVAGAGILVWASKRKNV